MRISDWSSDVCSSDLHFFNTIGNYLLLHTQTHKSFSNIMAKKPRIPATVGPFTFAYPHLTAPDSEGTYADNKYKVDGVVDPTSPAGKAVQAEVSKALKALGLGKDAQLPLKKQTEKDEKGKKVTTGKLVYRTKSERKSVV